MTYSASLCLTALTKQAQDDLLVIIRTIVRTSTSAVTRIRYVIVSATLAKLSDSRSASTECQQWGTVTDNQERETGTGYRVERNVAFPASFAVGKRDCGEGNLLRAEAFVYARAKNLDHGEGRGARATQYRGVGRGEGVGARFSLPPFGAVF